MNKYFDYAATSLPNMVAIKKVMNKIPSYVLFGNPSSLHSNGILAKKLMEQQRELLSSLLTDRESDIIFTSGGTESDNLAIKGTIFQYKPGEAEIITSKIEHPAVLNTCKYLENLGYKVHYISVYSDGEVDLDELKSKINEKTKLVSIMAVNNEIGTVEPLREIREIIDAKKQDLGIDLIFHSDFVQSVGNCDLLELIKYTDMASFSAHKFGGLKGVGFLTKQKDIKLNPLFQGGNQENGLRSGTENVFGILVMNECFWNVLKNFYSDKKDKLAYYRDEIFNKIKSEIPNAILNGLGAYIAPTILNIGFKDIDARTLQMLLNNDGFAVSVGSACHSDINEVSHVLKAINVPEEYQNGCIRISLSYSHTKRDIDTLVKSIIKNVKYLKSIEEV